jgi:hypothetical protein
MNTTKSNNNSFFPRAAYLAFFAVVLFYFTFFGNHIFFYQEKSSLFIFSLEFLYENLHQPGGFLIWLGKFFTTFYYNPLIGAIILSAFLTLLIILTSGILIILTGKKHSLIPYIPGASLFFLQTDYRFMLFNILGLLLELSLLVITLRNRTLIKGWLPVLLVPVLFFISGGFLWIFLLSMTFYYGFYEEKYKWPKITALWLFSFVCFYLAKEFLFFQSGKTLMTFPFSDLNTGSQQILFLLSALLISALPLISKITIRAPWISRRSDLTINLITTLILIVVIIIMGMVRFDKKAKEFYYVEKLFFEDKFNEVVAFNSLNQTGNILTLFLNNIALSETEKMNDMLFHFPQSKEGKTLFLKWELVKEILDRGGYFYYSIGMINEAHRWAYENMVMNGNSPEGIKMLIKTELINSNYKAASMYINLLKRTLFYRKDAAKFEKMLFSDSKIDSDIELGRKRRTRIENDFFSITDNPYINIEMILGSDSLNKKAFEYKMAYMLIKKNFKGIELDLPRFEKLGFTSLPVHVEEAAIALSVSNKGILPDMGSLQISNNTELRWNQYLSVLKQYGNDVKKAEPELRSRFGNTFWYYVFYK